MTEELVIALKDFEEDFQWFLRNREKLLSEYKDKWVVIYGKKVFDSDTDLSVLLERLRHKGFQPSQLLVQFVSREPVEAIL
ncbi:MAG: DUF5678 domain-containing protein [Thermoproteota archaeon]